MFGNNDKSDHNEHEHAHFAKNAFGIDLSVSDGGDGHNYEIDPVVVFILGLDVDLKELDDGGREQDHGGGERDDIDDLLGD